MIYSNICGIKMYRVIGVKSQTSFICLAEKVKKIPVCTSGGRGGRGKWGVGRGAIN